MVALKKYLEEQQKERRPELNLCRRKVGDLEKLPISLASFSHITRLNLSCNGIKELPASIKLLPLEHLNVFSNKLRELPAWIGQLGNLKTLIAANNRLYALPPSLCTLAKLSKLDVSNNNIEELPLSFASLTNLRMLYISDNFLQRLPEDLGRLALLEVLAVRDNDINQLPESIGDIVSLRELLLQNNMLSTLPPSLANVGFHQPRRVLKMAGNPLNKELDDRARIGMQTLSDYLASRDYAQLLEKLTEGGGPADQSQSDGAKLPLDRQKKRKEMREDRAKWEKKCARPKAGGDA